MNGDISFKSWKDFSLSNSVITSSVSIIYEICLNLPLFKSAPIPETFRASKITFARANFFLLLSCTYENFQKIQGKQNMLGSDPKLYHSTHNHMANSMHMVSTCKGDQMPWKTGKTKHTRIQLKMISTDGARGMVPRGSTNTNKYMKFV